MKSASQTGRARPVTSGAAPVRLHRRTGPLSGFAGIIVVVSTLLFTAHPHRAISQERFPEVAEFRSRLETLLADSILSRASVGIDIVRVEDGARIASINADKLFHPASTMKLVTSAAAIATLPADYAFRTELFSDAGIRDSTLEGDLYVRGGGDPLFDMPDVDSLAALVELAGIRRIRGDLVGDESRFDTLHWGKGWQWDDEPSTEEAFTSALSFHENSVTVTVGPAPRVGGELSVAIDPVPGYFTVVNLSSTSGARGDDSVTVRRPVGTNRIVVEGHLSRTSPSRTFDLSVFNPAGYFLEALRTALAGRGVTLRGRVRTGVTAGSHPLGYVSTSLGAVLHRMNKQSSNLCAENVLKVIGLETSGPPGSAGAGIRAVGDYLRAAGTDPGAMILADGSGVSWYNAVSPGDLVAVLIDQYRRKSTFRMFFESLPVSGMDGTLRTRMRGGDAAGRIAAKTGTIAGVSTLSGYAMTLSHDLLAFSIMINHYPGKIDELRDLQDRILNDLVRLRGDN